MSAQPEGTEYEVAEITSITFATPEPTVRARLAEAVDTDAVMPVATPQGNPWSFGKGLVRPWNRDYREFPSI